MAGVTGKGSLSIKKLDVSQSKLPALGFKKTVFAHKATAGSTTISLTALTTPTEMTANGFTQATLAELTSVNIRQYKENFTLVSSLRGTLQPFLGYVVTGGTTIKLLFSAEDGEIFIGTFDANPRTFTAAADAIPLSVSDTLLAGSTDFNVGQAFTANLYPNSQHGAVMVFRRGRLQFRNTGNNPPGAGVTGDYYEVPAGNGLAVIIRFNTANPAEDDAVSAVSIGSLIQAPTGSEIAMIEALQGQIDAIVPTVAALAGVSESTFQAVPNQPNLKAFGDAVISNTARITTLENKKIRSSVRADTGNGHGSTATFTRRFTNFVTVGSAILAADSATNGTTFTIQEDGIYAMSYTDISNGTSTPNWGFSIGTAGATDITAIAAANRLAHVGVIAGDSEPKTVSVTFPLTAGTVVRPNTNALPVSTSARVQFTICKVGE